MSDSRVPTEVELAFEVMPCNALRVSQEPGCEPHACAYFRKWGTYHSYDYEAQGPPPTQGIVSNAQYLGRASLVPELLSGCRKAPIMAVGINPNLPGWWPATRNSLNPLFDEVKQFAHYFRYRSTAKLELSKADYVHFGGGPADIPSSNFELMVPPNAEGHRTIAVQLQNQKMYLAYQSLLDDLAAAMAWPAHKLAVGEDLSYGNMVACPSAKWTTKPDPADPLLPAMTEDQRAGIVGECFRERRYFLRQLFQSLPTVLLIFSQNTANAFIGELKGRFSKGNPQVGEPVATLLNREVLLKYGTLPGGDPLDARVIFAPHPTGNPSDWALAKPKVIAELVKAAQAGRFIFNEITRHLSRPAGSCVFCTMLEIGDCEYTAELRPLAQSAALELPGGGPSSARPEKGMQLVLLNKFVKGTRPSKVGWDLADDAKGIGSAKTPSMD
jgi:hypothetical protein